MASIHSSTVYQRNSRGSDTGRGLNVDMHLKDKVALVTGGSRGLGRGICLGLAAEGAKVAVNYTRNAEMAEQVVRELQKKDGVQAVAVQGDVANSAEVVRMVSSRRRSARGRSTSWSITPAYARFPTSRTCPRRCGERRSTST